MGRPTNLFAAACSLLALLHSTSALAQEVDQNILKQMQDVVAQQQKLLDQQTEQLRQQSQGVEALQKKLSAINSSPVLIKPQILAATPSPLQQTVNSGNDRIKLSISGQINRAINIASDGGKTRLYHVDNAASGTRIRLVGSAAIDSDLALGTRIEVAIAPDNSYYVSQTNQTPEDPFNIRWAEVSLQSKKFGKLSLGKGDTASKGTAIVDLSRTDLVQYSAIYDIAGGLLFRKADSTHALTAINLKTAFKNHDGLGRNSRLRYDSPSFMGFTLAGSIVSEQRSDLALYWGAAGYGFQAAGAAAVSNPRILSSGLMYDGSFSALHTDSGINFTIAGGMQKIRNRKDATNLYGKLGWIARLTSLGTISLGLDYTNSGNLAGPDDRGYSVGGAVVQAFDRYATELYLQYRSYRLDRATGFHVDNINVSTLGVRVKF